MKFLRTSAFDQIEQLSLQLWGGYVQLWLLRVLAAHYTAFSRRHMNFAQAHHIHMRLHLIPVAQTEGTVGSTFCFDEAAIRSKREVFEAVFDDRDCPVHPQITELAREFRLSDRDLQMITFLRECGGTIPFKIIAKLTDAATEQDLCGLIASALDQPVAEVLDSVGEGSWLRRSGLVALVPGDDETPVSLVLNRWLTAKPGRDPARPLLEYLTTPFEFCEKPRADAIDFPGTQQAMQWLNRLCRFGSTGQHLVIHGGCRSVRAALARRVCAEAGGRPFQPSVAEDSDGDVDAVVGMVGYRQLVALLATAYQPVVVVPDADALLGELESRQREAERLCVMSDARVPTLWLVERLDAVDEHVLSLISGTVDVGGGQAENGAESRSNVISLAAQPVVDEPGGPS